MNAREAYEKALWLKLPRKLRNKIELKIEDGRFCAYFFESNEPSFFQEVFYNSLRDLGYVVEIFPFQFENGKIDNKLVISWNCKI